MDFDDADLNEAVAVVLSYAAAMNDWETRRWKVDDGWRFSGFERYRKLLAGYWPIKKLKAEYRRIFSAHCTDRKRVYSGFPSSWRDGGKYPGVKRDAILTAESLTRGRIEVTAPGGVFPGQQYKFVLFRKAGVWRIDNLLSKSGDAEWRRSCL